MKRKIVSKKALAPIEIKASKRRLFQTGNPSCFYISKAFCFQGAVSLEKTRQKRLFSIFACLKICWKKSAAKASSWFPGDVFFQCIFTPENSPLVACRWLWLFQGSSCRCHVQLFGCFVISLDLRGSLRCWEREKCEFSHHPNPRKLQPRRICRLIHDFEHFRSAKWKRWPDYTSPRTSMEPRNEKENHLNHPLPFWGSSR